MVRTPWSSGRSGVCVPFSLELGLLDEISIDLAPVLFGSGVPDLEQLEGAPILLDGPTPGHPWRPRSPTSGTASAVPEAALVFASLLR